MLLYSEEDLYQKDPLHLKGFILHSMPDQIMPPNNKATPKSGKKGKTLKKRVPAVASTHSDTEGTSGGEGEGVSVKDLLSSMTTMMAALHTRMDAMEDDRKKRRKVAFCRETPD